MSSTRDERQSAAEGDMHSQGAGSSEEGRSSVALAAVEGSAIGSTTTDGEVGE